MARASLEHWMLHNDQLAKEYDAALKFSPDYDPLRAIDLALSLHAPLTTGIYSIPGAIRGVFRRNSFGTYRAPRGRYYLLAFDDESRHEYSLEDQPQGVLMETASTNKCESFTDPDPDLTGWNLFNEPAATLTRVNDKKELADAGLLVPGMSSYVYKFDNSQGSANAWVRSDGVAGNGNPHVVSAYCRGMGRGQLRLSDQSAGNQDLPEDYERIANTLSGSANSLWECRITGGSVIYFKFHQLEEQEVATSFIVNHGNSVSRPADRLVWPLAGAPYSLQILADPGFNNAAQWTVTAEVLIANGLCTFDTTAPNRHARDEDYSEIRRGKWYRLSVHVPRLDAGRFTIRLYDELQGYSQTEWITEPGQYELAIQLTGTEGSGSFTGTVLITSDFSVNDFDIQNIQIREAQPIFNQTEGMAALFWRPSYGEGVLPSDTQRALATLRAGNTSLIYVDTVGATSFATSDGINSPALVIAGGLEAGRMYLIAVRWQENGTFQIGYKVDGAWNWSAALAYSGSYDEEGFLQLSYQPESVEHYRHVHLWAADRGTAWLENFFGGVGN